MGWNAPATACERDGTPVRDDPFAGNAPAVSPRWFSRGSQTRADLRSAAKRFLTLRCEAQHNIELRRQLADARFLHWRELDSNRLALFGIANTSIDAVALVARIALDVALGREQFLAALLDLEV